MIYAEILSKKNLQNLKISELPFLKNIKNLPEWTNKIKWNTEFYFNKFESDIEYWNGILNGTMLNKIVKLSNNFHGDLICIIKHDDLFYIIILGSKYYSEKMNKDEINKNLRSCDLNLAYINNYCNDDMTTHKPIKKNEHDIEIIQNILKKTNGIIKIHIDLPNTNFDYVNINNNEINLHFDKNNINDFVNDNVLKELLFLIKKIK
jgi:hypothetical protein